MKANDFLNSLGVTAHMVQSYDTEAQVTSGIQYIGVRHWRDDYSGDPVNITHFCNIHNATGATLDGLPYRGNMSATFQFSWDLIQTQCGGLFAVEGDNEPNNFNYSYNGNLCSQSTSFLPCAQHQRDLYAMVKADSNLHNLPVFAETEPGAEPDNVGLQFIAIPAGSGTSMPDGTVFADYANLHNYVRCNGCDSLVDNQAWNAESTGAQAGPYDGLDGEFLNQTFSKHFPALPLAPGPALPRVTTETGWATDGSITQDQQGKLLVNVYLSAAKRNWAYTFIYQLIDDNSGDHYGMFTNTSPLTPKLSANYIHNLTAILADSSSNFGSTALSYSISNEPATVHDLLLQKSDRTYALAVWGDQVVGESVDVTVNLPRLTTVSVYDVTTGTSPVQAFNNISSIPLMITDHAMILEFK
jgi:hypothetical protein